MKKFYLKSIVALTALFGLGTMNVAAQDAEEKDLPVLPVKMTYVDQSTPETIIGEVDTIRAGYNKEPNVGGTIGFGNTSWGCNWIGVLQVDATAIPGTITKATLKAKISGSTDSKRNTGWGVALTDNAWSNELNYAAVGPWTVAAKLNGGSLVWSTQKAGNVFEEVSFDVTEALQGAGFKGFATLLVYETQAAGGYMTEAEVEVEYDPYEATTTKFDFEDDNKVFADDSRITGAIEANEALGSKVLGWTCANNAQNGYCFSHYDFTNVLNNPALVKVEFDYYNTQGGRAILNIGDAIVRGNTGGSSKTTYNKTGVIFQIGSDKNDAFINGIVLPQANVVTSTTVTVTDDETGETSEVEVEETQMGLCNRWLHVILMVNNDAKTVTWVVDDKESGDNIHFGTSPFFAEDANSCTQIDLFGYINNSHCAMLDNLEITNYKSNAVFADYAVKYVDADGNELKEARASNGQVGKPVTLIDADKASFYNEDNSKKYIYDADNSGDLLIAESGTEVLIQFREAEVYNAVLNCMIEGTSGVANRLAQFMGTFFEGDNYYIRPSRGYNKDGKYYFTDADSYNGKVYTLPGSVVPVTQGGKTYYIGTLYYSAVDSVAYYSEFERLALPTTDEGNGVGLGQLVGTVNSWWSYSGGAFDRFSGGRGIRLDAGSYVYTEPIAEAATYKVTIYGRNDVSAATENPIILGILKEDGSQLDYVDLTIPTWGSATTGPTVVEGVAIPAGAKLVVKNDDAAKKISLDDISLTKTGDYVEPNLVSGIQEVQVAGANAAIYSISGQRLNAAPAKGLYIQNGKKFVVK